MTFMLLWKGIDSFPLPRAWQGSNLQANRREREREGERERTRLVMYETTLTMKNFLFVPHGLLCHSQIPLFHVLCPPSFLFYVSRALEKRESLVMTHNLPSKLGAQSFCLHVCGRFYHSDKDLKASYLWKISPLSLLEYALFKSQGTKQSG